MTFSRVHNETDQTVNSGGERSVRFRALPKAENPLHALETGKPA